MKLISYIKLFMKFYLTTSQNKLARLLNHKGEPGWCGVLCCFMYRFINHHKFVPDLDTWINFCKLNYNLLLEHDKLPKDKVLFNKILCRADYVIKEFSGTDCHFEYNVLFSNDIKLHKDNYLDVILKKLQIPNKFIFLCFSFKNKSFRMITPKGVHCISMWNHNNKIYLYDSNLGISDINFQNKKLFKQSLHKIMSLYSESYLSQLIESHLYKHSQYRDMSTYYKFIKWHRRYDNLKSYFGYNFLNSKSSKEPYCMLYTAEISLDQRIFNNDQFKYLRILKQIHSQATLEPDYELHFNTLRKNGIWN